MNFPTKFIVLENRQNLLICRLNILISSKVLYSFPQLGSLRETVRAGGIQNILHNFRWVQRSDSRKSFSKSMAFGMEQYFATDGTALEVLKRAKIPNHIKLQTRSRNDPFLLSSPSN